MKLATLLIYCSISAVLGFDRNTTSALVARIIDEYYVQRHKPLLVESHSSQLNMVNQVIGSLRYTRTVQINNRFVPGYKSWYYTVLFLENYREFAEFADELTGEDFNLHGYYTFVLSEMNPTEVASMFNDLLALKIIRALIIVSDSDRPQLYSYSPYSANKCGSPNIYRLHHSSSTVLFTANLNNFYDCPLRLGTFESLPFIHLLPPAIDNRSEIEGFEGRLITTIAGMLNFKLQVVTPPDGAQWGVPKRGNGSTGLMRILQDGTVDFGLSCLGLIADRIEILQPGRPHYASRVVFAVPDGQPYTPFEKLFQPFDRTSWLMMLTIAALAVFVVFVLKFCPNTVRSFVYGVNNRFAFLNTLAVCYVGSIPNVPRRTFARTVLILWIVHCMLIRSIYQGSLFKYLQADLKHSPVETLQEIEQSNLHYYMIKISERFFLNNAAVLRRVRHIQPGNDSLNVALDLIATKRLRDGVVLVTSEHVAFHNKYRLDKGFVRSTRDHVVSYPIVMYYPKRSFLVPAFNRMIGHIQTAGLIQYWVQRYGNYDFFPKEIRTVQPTTMSNRPLQGCYEVCAVLLIISVVVFLLELLSTKVAVLRRILEFAADKKLACVY